MDYQQTGGREGETKTKQIYLDYFKKEAALKKIEEKSVI